MTHDSNQTKTESEIANPAPDELNDEPDNEFADEPEYEAWRKIIISRTRTEKTRARVSKEIYARLDQLRRMDSKCGSPNGVFDWETCADRDDKVDRILEKFDLLRQLEGAPTFSLLSERQIDRIVDILCKENLDICCEEASE